MLSIIPWPYKQFDINNLIQIILKQIYFINRWDHKNTTNTGEGWSDNSDKEVMTPNSLHLRNWRLTARFILAQYSECHFKRFYVCRHFYLFHFFRVTNTCFLLARIKLREIYLFNGITTSYGLFNIEIWLIYKCLTALITFFSMFFLLVCL